MGQGTYLVGDEAVVLAGQWQVVPVDLATAGAPASNRVAELFQQVAALLTGAGEEVVPYARTGADAARFDFAFNGQAVEVIYSAGPDHGRWAVLLDGQPLLEQGQPVVVDARNPTPRYGVTRTLQAADEGEHRLTLVNQGGEMGIAAIEVLPPLRTSNLGAVLSLIVGTQVLLFLLAALLGPALFGRVTTLVDARRSIMLALVAYAVIAVWGFFLNSVIEFWFMAWMVAVVQGGSQALSRSLYADMTPGVMSGEFFGLFSIMSKFASFLSPLVFFVAIAWFGNSRPAILSIVIFFIVGIVLLARVDVDEGRRAAEATDAAILAD